MSNLKMKESTLKLTQLSILIALIAVLAFTPLGFIMIPPISMTTLHIPVVIGAILLGPTCGGILGFFFGLMSMIRATAGASPVDMLFSPFLSGEPISSLIMCYVSRILLGVVTGLIFMWLKKFNKNGYVAIAISVLIGTLVHSILVYSCLWFFFDYIPLKKIIIVAFSLKAIPEKLIAILITIAVCKPLFKLYKKV